MYWRCYKIIHNIHSTYTGCVSPHWKTGIAPRILSLSSKLDVEPREVRYLKCRSLFVCDPRLPTTPGELRSKVSRSIVNRVQFMTLGLVLVFIGTQLYFVDTYVLTPRVSKIVNRSASKNYQDASNAAQDFYSQNFYQNQSQSYQPYVQAGYSNNLVDSAGPRKRLTPPKWICWPVFFLGAVFFLHGIALPSSGSSD